LRGWGGEGGGGVGGKEGGEGRGEKWPKPCMHIWIIKEIKIKINKIKFNPDYKANINKQIPSSFDNFKLVNITLPLATKTQKKIP
jgi:hypothetical protein